MEQLKSKLRTLKQNSDESVLKKRSSILGRKQLNRFSAFVTTGVEDFLYDIDSCKQTEEKHYIKDGPKWEKSIRPLCVFVHTPLIEKDYIVFHLTTESIENNKEITVKRRFSEFEALFNILTSVYKSIVIPHLPNKQYLNKFEAQSVEKRRRLLERFINKIAKHPVLNNNQFIKEFLFEKQFTKINQKISEFNNHSFYNTVYHPEFNIDDDCEKETIRKFEEFASLNDKHMSNIVSSVQRFNESLLITETCLSDISYNVSLLAKCNNPSETGCVFDDCKKCPKLNNGLLEFSNSINEISSFYKSYINEINIVVERLKEYSYCSTQMSCLMSTYRETLNRHENITSNQDQNEETLDVEKILSRCDTVFNIILAEITHFHDERAKDIRETICLFINNITCFYEKNNTRFKCLNETFTSDLKFNNIKPNNSKLIQKNNQRSSLYSMSGILDKIPNLNSYFINQ